MGIMENKMETTIVYWGNIEIMEKKMETTIGYHGLWMMPAHFCMPKSLLAILRKLRYLEP